MVLILLFLAIIFGFRNVIESIAAAILWIIVLGFILFGIMYGYNDPASAIGYLILAIMIGYWMITEFSD